MLPVWENQKYAAPCEASCPTGIPVQRRWQLIREGREQCRVLRSEARWFGVTYREDTDMVRAALTGLHAAGAYPGRLWA